MQEFLSAAPDMDEMLKLLQKRILRELKMQYPDYIGTVIIWSLPCRMFLHIPDILLSF